MWLRHGASPAAEVWRAATIWRGDADWVSAAVPLVLAAALAFAVDLAFQRRGRHLAEALLRSGISRQADTRLRFVRRLVYAAILLVGIALTLSQIKGVDQVAASLLASGAIAAAIVGFAARQTLANFVAGVMLAITQPLRVGDWVTFEDHYGVVEDVRLNYTILRTASDQRVIVPNERIAGGVLVNDTLAVDTVAPGVAIWLPAGADVQRAVHALEQETGAAVTVAEVARDGVRLAVAGDPVPPPERAAREAELRARCLARLRDEQLLAG
jgi:small-conductance mechanosensitive channel